MDYHTTNCGYFGKLPIRGDFIQRNLDADFVSLWDEWLQRVISASRTTLGDQWLNCYLVSPIWRYTLCLDNGAKYAGIMLPSVDKVGRYFPFTISINLDKEDDVIEFVMTNNTWYEQAEFIALQALEEQIDYDQLNQAIENLSLIDISEPPSKLEQNTKAYRVQLSDNMSLHSGFSRIQSFVCSPRQQITSYWWNHGNDQDKGNLLCCLGMPDDTIFIAMLDGQWEYCPIHNINEV